MVSSDETEWPNGAERVEIGPSQIFSQALRQRTAEEFGSDGAWLLLSLVWYGWRAYYDLAFVAAPALAPEADPRRPRPFDVDFQIVKDLQVQGLLYAAAEQFATLVEAARAHEPGTGSFFQTYVARRDLRTGIDAVSDIPVEELAQLVGAPASSQEVERAVREARERDLGRELSIPDLGEIEVVDVAGLLVPRRAIEAGAIQGLFEKCQETVNLITTNLNQLRQFVDRPESNATHGVRPQSLREVDNSFRHGFRVLFHDALPERRVFALLGEPAGDETHAVDLYLPREGEEVRFATVICSPERTQHHLQALQQICTRIGQVARGFLGRQVFDTSALFISAVDLTPAPQATRQPP